MSKKVSITEQIEELQAENERLSNLQKLFEKAVKEEFGYSVKDLHKIINEHATEQPRKAVRKDLRPQKVRMSFPCFRTCCHPVAGCPVPFRDYLQNSCLR